MLPVCNWQVKWPLPWTGEICTFCWIHLDNVHFFCSSKSLSNCGKLVRNLWPLKTFEIPNVFEVFTLQSSSDTFQSYRLKIFNCFTSDKVYWSLDFTISWKSTLKTSISIRFFSSFLEFVLTIPLIWVCDIMAAFRYPHRTRPNSGPDQIILVLKISTEPIRSESESELLLVTCSNDNHSPGPAMREVSP